MYASSRGQCLIFYRVLKNLKLCFSFPGEAVPYLLSLHFSNLLYFETVMTCTESNTESVSAQFCVAP